MSSHIADARLGEERSVYFLIEGRKYRMRCEDIHNVLHGNQAAAQIWEVPVLPTPQTRLAVEA